MGEVGGDGSPIADDSANDKAWEWLDKRYPPRRMRTRTGIATCVALVIVACSHAFAREAYGLEVVASLVSMWLVWTASIAGHELGHAVAARVMGLRPFVLLAGGGPSIVRREVAGVAVDLGVLPGGGLTLIASDTLDARLKWRLFITYAGGPAISVALLALGLVAFPEQARAFQDDADRWIGPGTALVFVNGLILFTSVVPLPRPTDVISPRNDLTQMVTLPWVKPQTLESLVKTARGVAFFRYFQLRRYQAAFDEARRLLSEDPSNWMIRAHLADMLIFSRRHAEAAREYGALLDEPALSRQGVPPLGAALVANNYAWANFMQGGEQALDEAERATSKAINLVPNNPHVLGTRGAVLVARGEIEKGRELLERARKLHRGATERASNSACLALAAAAEGHRGEAERHFEQALRLDPDFELRSRVERVLRPSAVAADG